MDTGSTEYSNEASQFHRQSSPVRPNNRLTATPTPAPSHSAGSGSEHPIHSQLASISAHGAMPKRAYEILCSS